MTDIRYDHTEIKRTGPRKKVTDAQMRQVRLDMEAVLNNDIDELKVRRNGDGLKFISGRDSQTITLCSNYAQDRT